VGCVGCGRLCITGALAVLGTSEVTCSHTSLDSRTGYTKITYMAVIDGMYGYCALQVLFCRARYLTPLSCSRQLSRTRSTVLRGIQSRYQRPMLQVQTKVLEPLRATQIEPLETPSQAAAAARQVTHHRSLVCETQHTQPDFRTQPIASAVVTVEDQGAATPPCGELLQQQTPGTVDSSKH
jgi:hypothetical protein